MIAAIEPTDLCAGLDRASRRFFALNLVNRVNFARKRSA
jgi:hypothetical protein